MQPASLCMRMYVCARVCVCFACGRKDDVNDNGG